MREPPRKSFLTDCVLPSSSRDFDADTEWVRDFVRVTCTVKLYDGSRVVGEREIENSIDGWYFANWFGATLIGFLVIDPITGAMWTLEDHVTVYKDVESTDTKQSLQLQIVDIYDIPESQRDSLIAIGPEDGAPPSKD